MNDWRIGKFIQIIIAAQVAMFAVLGLNAFGIALIEVMAYGKPVIATDLGPFQEIIKDRETGFLAPVNSSEHLVSAIIEVTLDEKKRTEMGIKAREDIYNRFALNNIADDYLKIYYDLVNNKK